MSMHELEPAVPRRPGLVAVDGRTYPLESVRLDGRAEGGVAATTVTQRFANPFDEGLEVVYTLPLPADGAVIGYTIRMGEKIIRGEVQPRDRAAQSYRDALYEGRTAGLLEQDRADTFQQRLGNLPPRTAVEISIQVLQPLAFLAAIDAGSPQWEFRFPTVVGVRYEGSPGSVPDADRLDVDRGADGGIPTRIELSLTIGDRLDEPRVASPSHELVVEETSEGRVVRFAEGRRLDRDVVLRWAACRPVIGAHVVEGGGFEGDDGRYALVTVVPPIAATAVLHRDLTVLIDASGSMQGTPLDLAKRVVANLLSSLEPEDRFEVLAFASDVKRLTHGLERADAKAVSKALDRLDRLEAGGATEMLSAVEKALGLLRRDAQRQVVLVTDGYIGSERDVVGRIGRDSRSGVRVHTVGIGAAPNRTLLRGVALAGRGVELIAGDEATAIEAARRLRGATVRPVLTDLAVRGSAVRGVAPEHPRDVCAGQPLVLAVELTAEGGALEVTGRPAGTSEAWSWSVHVPEVVAREARSVVPKRTSSLPTTPLPIGALFGRGAIDDLELKTAARGPEPKLDQEIEACAMRHRIVSRMTSLVAIAEEPSVDPLAPRRRERLAVEMPWGVSADGAGMRSTLGLSGLMSTMAMRSSAPGSLLDQLASFVGAPGRAMHRQESSAPIAGTVIHVDGDLLIVEIEAPFDGFRIPSGEIEARLRGGRAHVVEIVAEQSTQAEIVDQGVLIRLAVRRVDGTPWPTGTIGLSWQARQAVPNGEVRRPVVVVVTIASNTPAST